MTKATVTTEQIKTPGGAVAYRVIKLSNTIAYRIGEQLSATEVQDILDNLLANVVVVPYSKRGR